MNEPLVAPKLEFVCDLKIKVGKPHVLGQTPHGLRRIIPIVGGKVEGPYLKGELLNVGADWQTEREDGVLEVDAHQQFVTDDGVTIYMKNTGIKVASANYFRATPSFSAPEGKYERMNKAVFICTGEKGEDGVWIRIWKVL